MKKNKLSLLMISILLIAFFANIAPLIGANNNKVELLIGFSNESKATQAVTNSGGIIIQTFTLIPAMHAIIPETALAALQKNPNIRYVEPNSEVYALSQTTPWGIDRVFGEENYSFPTWDDSTGAGIKVAVLDTGIDTNHEDLDVAGGVRFYLQGLRLRQDNNYNDDNGHGTHVAGTIAALNNNLGAVGVAFDIDLYSIKVLNAQGSGSISTIVAGIQWSVTNGMDIVSMSLGSSSHSQTLEDACNTAYSSGSLLVAAAGNSGKADGTGDNVGYPAKYASVIAVAATDQEDKRASWSSTGPAVELAAPGVSILSTLPENKYGSYSGTSMACPHVSGVAALVWAADPTLTNVEVRGILQTTAQDLGLSTEHQGYGLVRADAAVDMAMQTESPTPVYHDLTIAITGTGSTNPMAGTHSYQQGTQVSVTAIPDSGWTFDHWWLDSLSVGSENPYIVTMDNEHSLTAVFTEVTQPVLYTLTMEQPAGSGTVDPNVGTHEFSEGQVVTIYAIANVGYEFNSWIGDVTDVTSATTTVTMDYSKTVQAVFTEITLQEGAVSVDSIDYDTTGGRLNDQHLLITIALSADGGIAVAGASVSIAVYRNDGLFASATGTSGTDGTVTFRYNNYPSGSYTTDVTKVVADGLEWDGTTPDNSYEK